MRLVRTFLGADGVIPSVDVAISAASVVVVASANRRVVDAVTELMREELRCCCRVREERVVGANDMHDREERPAMVVNMRKLWSESFIGETPDQEIVVGERVVFCWWLSSEAPGPEGLTLYCLIKCPLSIDIIKFCKTNPVQWSLRGPNWIFGFKWGIIGSFRSASPSLPRGQSLPNQV